MIPRLRRILGDARSPYYWPDDELQGYLDDHPGDVYAAAASICRAEIARIARGAKRVKRGAREVEQFDLSELRTMVTEFDSKSNAGGAGPVELDYGPEHLDYECQ